MRTVKPMFIMIFGLGTALILVILLVARHFWLSEKLGYWHSITPSETTLGEAIKILGEPDYVIFRNGFYIHRFHPDPKGGWKIAEIWTGGLSLSDSVLVMLIVSPFHSSDKYASLDQLIMEFGRPEKVTWSFIRHHRYLIWPEDGVAAFAEANIYIREEWEDFYVGLIIFFKPRTLDDFMEEAKNWPWPEYFGGFSERNMNPPKTHGEDLLPEDPYEWSNMPTSQSSAP